MNKIDVIFVWLVSSRLIKAKYIFTKHRWVTHVINSFTEILTFYYVFFMTDLQPLEISAKSEINTMISQERNQSGMSPHKVLCLDKDVTDQEQTSNVTDSRKSIPGEVKDKLCLEKASGCSEFKSLNNFFLVVDESLETEKICLEGTEGLGLPHTAVDVPLDTRSSKASFNGVSNEMAHKRNHNTDASESSPFKHQFKLLPADLENATEKEITNHDQNKASLDSLLDIKLNLDLCKKHGLQDSCNVMLDVKYQKIKQMLREECQCSIEPCSCYQSARETPQPGATTACAAAIGLSGPSASPGNDSTAPDNYFSLCLIDFAVDHFSSYSINNKCFNIISSNL